MIWSFVWYIIWRFWVGLYFRVMDYRELLAIFNKNILKKLGTMNLLTNYCFKQNQLWKLKQSLNSSELHFYLGFFLLSSFSITEILIVRRWNSNILNYSLHTERYFTLIYFFLEYVIKINYIVDEYWWLLKAKALYYEF